MDRPAPRFSAPSLFLVLVTVLALLAVTLYIAFPHDFELWRMRRFEQPSLEAALGFKAGYITVPSARAAGQQTYAIISVSPDGSFWKAGIRAGDVPTGYKHGFELGFLQDLVEGRASGSVTLTFIPAEAAARGAFEVRRHARVIYPAGP